MYSTTQALPYFEVFANNVHLPQWARRLEIIEQTSSHQVALLDVEYIGRQTVQGLKGVAGSWQYLQEQTPMIINFGFQPNHMRQFVGYIASYTLKKSSVDKSQTGLISTCVQYTIIGASQIMQSTKNFAWKNTSPSTIAGQIATNNGLRSIIHPYTAAITYRLQNQSDFKFLAKLASEIGYRFYVDNTDLYFVNPQQILSRSNMQRVPQFWAYNKPGAWDTLRHFEPIVGTITPDGGVVANRTISGINPNTGQTLSVNDSFTLFNSPTSSAISPTITKYFNDTPADSFFEAQQKVTADTNANLYWLTAECTVRGDSQVRPNTLIEIVGSGIPETEQGFWLVQGVRHVLTLPAPSGPKVDAKYTAYIQIARDQIYSATATAPDITAKGLQIIPPTLIQGTWRSSNIGAQIVVR